MLRTADAPVSHISGAQLGASLTGYVLTYSLMLLVYFVVLDDYDLGVGMLMPAATPDQQELMVA